MSNDRLLGKWKEKSESTLIEIWSSSDMKKNALDMKVVEDEDCFILDFDPFESIDLSKKLNISMDDDNDNDASDLSVIAERGQVACRDYPHSRHLCVKFPFNRTSHESYCEQCYCYVCDSIAPCKYWTGDQTGHCHATEHDDQWKCLRKLKKPVPVISKANNSNQ